MIKTKRLKLKPYSDDDQDDVIRLLTNDIIKKTFMIPELLNQAEAIACFKKLKESSHSLHHYELGIYYEQKCIGWVNDVTMEQDTIEIGYVIDPAYHNQGYATEVLQAVISDLFNKGYHEVIAGAFISNQASIRVMEKCGMKLIDMQEDIVYQGVVQHCIYYAIKN